MTWNKAIETRKSVRTFSREEPLSAAQTAVITEAVAEANADSRGLFTCTWAPADAGDGDFKPSTYGTIKDAAGFIPVAFDLSDPATGLAVGRALEKAVLSLTKAGVATCWIGGTFKAASFASAIQCQPPRRIALVIAAGIDSGRRRLLERMTSAMAGSKTRRPFDSLFTAPDGTLLPADSPWRAPLRAMRLAPSSLNSQPWRAVVDGDTAHFFVAAKARDNYVDMGIGLAHVALVASEQGLVLSDCSDPAAAALLRRARYVCSATIARR